MAHQRPNPMLQMSPRRQRRCRRVVLLLDLDCFYAQCESVRLGLDPTMPLALLQWNSALAVNYPARDLGVKRGDSYESIRAKGCVALHLPVMPVDVAVCGPDDGGGRENVDDGDHGGDASIEAAYDAEFRLSRDVRERLFREEKNRMRKPSEGKASLERYRLASSRIFSVMMAALSNHIGKGRFILERASIDELFLDVSDHCYNASHHAWAAALERRAKDNGEDGVAQEEDEGRFSALSAKEEEEAIRETVAPHHVGRGGGESWGAGGAHDQDEDDDEMAALRRGCVVAWGVRRAVFDQLGFTLSAGVSTSKLVSKLAASYGKPNGQAVIFPSTIPQVMEGTKIRKVRHLGGKVGKKVQTLLPDSEQTIGSVARLLSLDDLVKAVGAESGRMVFDACRGIDSEPVRETVGALTKSITAFKSFSQSRYPELEKWVTLLATDVVSRVDLDTKRNGRYPKSCSIQYIYSKDGTGRITRSMRIPFPRASDLSARKQQILLGVRAALEAKGHFPIFRLGLSATEFFDVRVKNSIDTYFSAKRLHEEKVKAKREIEATSTCAEQVYQTEFLETRGGHDTCVEDTEEAKVINVHGWQSRSAKNRKCPSNADHPATPSDPDLEYARSLQAKYDRENNVLEAIERSRDVNEQKRKSSAQKGTKIPTSKKNKIDNFFSKKR